MFYKMHPVCTFCLILIIFFLGICSSIEGQKPLSTQPFVSSVPPGVTRNHGLFSKGKSAYADFFNDKLWKNQWYAHDYRTVEGPVMDHNIVPVYKLGFYGEGVKLAVLAEGLQNGHPDLSPYSETSEIHTENVEDDDNGSEEDKKKKYRANGTQAVGVISMVQNNAMCGVGVAWRAEVIHKELAWHASRTEIHSALESLNADIYQTIWDHNMDDGMSLADNKNVDVYMREAAFNGRSGKGSIFVVDVGNGKLSKDNCAVDSVVNSVHAISVAAANQMGKVTSYSERCAGVFATAYSGDNGHEGIVTTNTGSICQTNAKGAAIAATLASGIIALTLQANPKLTYRDVQHIVAMSSEVAPLADNSHSWRQNKAGFWISYDFGFGLLNAENMVRLADPKTWKGVPEVNICTMTFLERSTLSPGTLVTFTENSDGCQHDADERNRVKYLEQVELVVNFQYNYRGALRIELTSPSKTTTTILEPRPHDQSTSGLSKWRIRSLHTWGEVAQGPWQVSTTVQRYRKGGMPELMDTLIHGSKMVVSYGMWGSYEISDLKLVMHGTWERPAHYANSAPYRRQYSAFNVDSDTLPH